MSLQHRACKHIMYIFTECILIMDLASGLCHYCTMGLPPEKLFYLYIPIGCLDSSLLLQTEWDSCDRESFAVLVEVVSIVFVHWGQIKRQEGAITWRQRATYCVGTLFYGLHVMTRVWAPCLFGPEEAGFCIYTYIYIKRLTTFQRNL